MSCNEIHVGDYGTAIRIVILNQNGDVQPINSAISYSMVFTKPNGESLTVSPSLYTDGTDGILEYITVDGDVDQAGTWQVQAIITYSSSRVSSSIEKFKVSRNL